jgi:hypothetical protein
VARTLALLDVGEETWAVADLLRVRPIGLTAEELAEAAEGPLRRMLLFQGGGMRFRDDTFRQVIAADALDQDRSRGRDLAVALVDILGGMGTAPSPFLSEYATAQSASFVLRYADGDASLAYRLLVSTPWPALRFRQTTTDAPSLGPLLEEMRGLLRASLTAGQAGDIGPVHELLETLAQWRPAIEAGDVRGDHWWPRLPVAALGHISPSNSSAAARVDGHTILLAPAGGYGLLQPGNCELNGAACAAHDGVTERIALAATRGRLLSYVKRGGEYVFERLHFFETGIIVKLKSLEGTLVLALTSRSRGEEGIVLHLPTGVAAGPDDNKDEVDEKDGVEERQKSDQAVGRRLWLVDLTSPLPPVEIDIPGETADFAVLHAVDGCAAVILAVGRDRWTEMRSFQLNYGRELTTASSLRLAGDGGVFDTEYQVKELCSFAPDTWAAFGTVGGDWSGECVLSIHRHSPAGIGKVTDTAVADMIRKFWITGVCPLPDDRLAVVRFPKTPNGEGAALLVLRQEGTVDLLVPITPTPRCRVVAMLGSEVPSNSSYQPLGWHRHLHLLLGHSQSAYHCLSLEPEAVPRPLPADIERHVLYSDDAGTTLLGACPLQDGRVLLAFRGFAAVLGPGPSEIVRVTSDHAGSACLLGPTRAGSIAACDVTYRDDQGNPVRVKSNYRYLHPPGEDARETLAEEGFLNIGPEGVSLSLSDDGVRLTATHGGQQAIVLYDAMSDPGIPADSKTRRILHAVARDERNWTATVIAMQGDGSSNRGHMRIVGRTNSQPMGLLIQNVDGSEFYDGFGWHIRTLCGTVVGIERAATECVIRERRLFDLVLFDLPLESDHGKPCTDFMSHRLDGREDHFSHPVIHVSGNWALVLGPCVTDTLPYTDDAVFTVSQYRIGSLESPSLIQGLTLGGRAQVLETSPDRVDLLDLRRVGARTHAKVLQLHVDHAFGARLLPQQSPAIDLGRSVKKVITLYANHVVVSYDSIPFRVEVRSLWPCRGEELAPPVAVGYLSEPPEHILMSRSRHGVYLVVATENIVTWFDLRPVCILG